jgi:hypothetical protein
MEFCYNTVVAGFMEFCHNLIVGGFMSKSSQDNRLTALHKMMSKFDAETPDLAGTQARKFGFDRIYDK